MAEIHFTPNLRRHLRVESAEVPAGVLAEALETTFARNPGLRSYIVDDQGRLRPHVAIYVDGRPVQDRVTLRDEVGKHDRVYVMQALSGG